MLTKLRTFFELIKFEHTIFALPFAYLGMVLAERQWPVTGKVIWITLAMVAGRTFGMILNRIADIKTDSANPRTKGRPLVTGRFTMQGAWIAAVVSLGIFFLSAWELNPLCFKLSFLAIIFLGGYHFAKRFTHLSHFVLGFTLGMAPIGGWLAVTGEWSFQPVILGLAVMFWVAGFDIIYALQDMDFDRSYGLHSLPVKMGERGALKISRYCHVVTGVCLVVFGIWLGLGIVYWVGLVLCLGLLAFEQRLVDDLDLNRINTAFFNVNGWIGIFLFLFTYLDIFR